jgi:amino acid adenylation domain-containing protein/non-ribosomal peptide synthase protein (TIGR01720 family)
MSNQSELSSKNVQNIYRLSPMQEGIYFHSVMDDASDAYFCQNAYRVRMPLQNALLEKSLQLLVDRHDVLRTVFSHQKTEHCIQVVLKKRLAGILFQDISDADNKEQTVEQFKGEDRKKGFDLAKDMLLRLAVFKLNENEYELVWSHHHILMDGWCSAMMMQEFTQLYQLLQNGEAIALPQPAQFGSYIDWLQNQDVERADNFWKEYVHGFTQPTGLQSKMKTASRQVFEETEVLLSKEVCHKIQELTASHKLTANIIYQAAWSIVLSMLNRTNDVAFGAVVSVRPPEIKGIENMLGLFINTLPVRISVDENKTVLELLHETQRNALLCAQHQFCPLHRIQSFSAVKEQLIDHLFIMENFGSAFSSDEKRESQQQVSFSGTFSQTNYNLNIVVLPGEQTAIRFNFNKNIFRKDHICAAGRMFNTILEQMVLQPAQTISSLNLISVQESDDLLQMGFGLKQQWTGTVAEMFTRQAFMYPGRIAVVAEDGTEITYGQLHKKTKNLGMILSAAGCGRGNAIGVHTGNTVHTVVSLMAIHKIGAVYVPLDMALPNQRLLHIVKDAGVGAVLVQSGSHELLSGFEGTLIQADTDYDCPCMDDLSSHPDPDDIAYIIYTSGTTGVPKGVPIKHKSIADRIAYHNHYLPVEPGDKVLQFGSVAFDASLVEIFMALTTGATLVLISKACKENVELLKEKIDAAGVTTAIFPPAYLKLLQAHELPSLNKIISTGEAAILPDMLAHAQTRKVVNGYGPTETCVGASFHTVDVARAGEYEQRGALPIGKPFSNTHVYIIGHHKKLLPQGCAGEIYIAGPGLSGGYLNRAELTEEKFIANPFSTGEGYYKMYCTGDAGYWNEHGELEYEGRIDQQVQVRGMRIEPAEIEKLILQQQGVTEAVVIQAEISGEHRLLAYIQALNEINEQSIRTYLQDRVPAYMIPWKFIQIDQLPLNAAGKIDRNNLPLPAVDEEVESIVQPVTKAEQDLADALCALMRKETISLHSHFLEMGGDSIKAIQLISRLYRQGWKLELKDVFRYPVLKDMALRMQGTLQVADQRVVEGEVPLSPIQLDFFERRLRHQHHFNQSVLLKHKASLDAAVIDQLLKKIFEHHDALRMVYDVQDGKLKQFNKGLEMFPVIESIDLRKAPDAIGEMTKHAQRIQESFSLSTGPLLKAAIFRMADGDRLLLCAHHLVVDGISWRIIMEDIGTLYEQTIQGKNLQLPPKTDSFKTWAEQLHQYAASELCSQEMNYWLENILTEDELLPLTPTGLPEGTARTGFELDDNQTSDLLSHTNHAYRTEVNDVLLSALAQSLSDVFGADKILIALEGHGRQGKVKADVSRTVGWFTSVYPVALDASNKLNTSLHIRTIKEQLRSIPDKGTGYGILRYINRQLLNCAEPQILFNYLGQVDGENEQSDFSLATEHAGHNTNLNEKILYPVTVTAIVLDGKLKVTCRYDVSKLKNSVAQRISELLQRSLTRIIAHCRTRNHTQITPSDLVAPIATMDQLENINKKYDTLCGSTVADLYPLSPMQEGMLFHELIDNESGAYIYQISYRIKGKVNVNAVAQTANQLAKRHDILRTVFHYKDTDSLLQAVLADRPVDFTFTVLQGDAELRDFLQSDKNKTFDLEKDSLFRLALLKLSQEEYVFVWTCHHILMDGWCMGILISEFRELYESTVSGKPHRLPQPAPFRNYIQWLQQSSREKALEYWSNYLHGYESKISLQHHQSERQKPGYEAGHHTQQLTTHQTKKLKELCYQSGATLYDCMAALWGILLCKYNHCTDAVFGTIVSGRPPVVEGIERMLGLFINMIPMRIRYNSSTLFANLLSELRNAAADGEQYHYCSLAQLQSRTALKNHPFDHFIELENYPVQQAIAKEAGEMDWQVSEVTGHEHTHYDFSFTISDGEQTGFTFHYNKNVYPHASMNLIAEHFNCLLLQVLENRWANINSLVLNTPAQLQQLLQWSNGAHRNYPVEKGFVDLFMQKVAEQPKSIAVSDAATTFTYAQLHEAALAIASVLKNDHAIEREEIVALCMERSVWMTAAIIGTWMAGGAYLPLDPQLPEERIKYMMQDAGVRNCLAAALTNTQMSALSGHTVINAFSSKGAPVVNVPVELNAGSLSYVIYTSGSTGKPKGVMIEQGGMLNHLFNKIEALQINEHSCIAQTAAIGFDISVWQFVCPLLVGGQVRIFSHADVLQPEKMFSSVENEKITHWQVSPVYLCELLSFVESRKNIPSLASLKFMIVTGEALKPNLVKRWFALFPSIALVNAYGPTEASDDITHAILREPPATARIPIGMPLNNFQIHVKDANGELCAAGVPGEIFVMGAGIGRGYVGKPQHDNFIKNGTERIYRTGDWGIWSADGQLYFIGRKDDQLKINGHRIEIGEIENTLAAAPGIAEAVVIASKQGEQYTLVAFIQRQPGCEADVAELKNWLRQRLTDYMIPSMYVEVDKFPVTVNGKIDREALAQLKPQTKLATVQLEPSTEKEQALAVIWQQVLGVTQVSSSDDFFDCGGDSIRAIQITSRLYTVGYKLEVQDIFDTPVLAQLAERLRPLSDEPGAIETGDESTTDDAYAEISDEEVSMINNLFN